MQRLFLSEGGPPVRIEAFSEVEKALDFTFPKAFKSLYLKCNGGRPNLEFWNGDTQYEPFRIEFFNPVQVVGEEPLEDQFDLLGFATAMLQKNAIPKTLVPFAFDEADNFICFEKPSGRIIYYTADAFQADVHLSLNHLMAQRLLSNSFDGFCKALVAEEDLDY
ncbi:SMI1/KNR4 family protein [Pseudomonas entomophila]|uniref:SMI1/KNR4 family protein n=1 Tax=Pseudomonas entomophila TaxID=312306 RepID=UPI0015E27378|nr:SMI1/KNR4 family protein [Pseudomonas entomophila]MBA1190287.1 SMI1/KNR4 family protein [Pseudomonas entomophila]